MRRETILLALVAISGCASVNGLRSKPADITANSAKPPAEVGSCIAAGWGEMYGVTVNQASTSAGGYTVNMPSQTTGNNGVVDITPNGPGSHVEVRYRLSGMGGYDKFSAVVKRCAP